MANIPVQPMTFRWWAIVGWLGLQQKKKMNINEEKRSETCKGKAFHTVVFHFQLNTSVIHQKKKHQYRLEINERQDVKNTISLESGASFRYYDKLHMLYHGN